MNKILVTGGKSFIAKTIVPELDLIYNNIFAPSHKVLDIKNQFDLYETFQRNSFNTVIHTACKGGRRTKEETEGNLYDNLLMLSNLLFFQKKYNFKLIVFSSGAEYDRRGNIFNDKEEYFNSVPTDYYGLSKYIQTQLIHNNSNTVNLRLFNVFSEIGMDDSFIHVCIDKALKNKPIEIWEDKFFSFFYGGDLITVINHFILDKNNKYQEYNLTYNDVTKLSDVAHLIIHLTNSTSKVIINNKLGKGYCGNGGKLNKLNFNFIGLEEGIKRVIRYKLHERN